MLSFFVKGINFITKKKEMQEIIRSSNTIANSLPKFGRLFALDKLGFSIFIHNLMHEYYQSHESQNFLNAIIDYK